MNVNRLLPTLALVAVATSLSASVSAQGKGKGNGGGDNSGGGDELATNDIAVRWGGPAVAGPFPPRDCFLGSAQPNGTHTVYPCDQFPDQIVSGVLTGGVLTNNKGKPSEEDIAACATGFTFSDYPHSQYVVAVGGGEICTDDDGCPLTVNTVLSGETVLDQTGYTHVKLVGMGRVPSSANLNPFSCPANADGSPNSYNLESIQLQLRNGGNKAEVVCLFSFVEGAQTFEVTPTDCP